MKTKMLIHLISILLAMFYSARSSKSNSITGIEGLWITTEETSSLFEPWAHKVALHIKKDSTKMLTARGFFILNDKFKQPWNFIKVRYDTTAKQISMLDTDSDTLICSLDAENKILKGAVHLQDTIQNPLDFVRADKNLEIRLIYPRFPDENGNIKYTYQKPEQIDDGLTAASIYEQNINSEALINLLEEIIMQKYGRLESLLVLKDNQLLLEEYFYGYDRTQTHNIYSCTKSITSLLLGLALDRHKEINTDASLFQFFPQYDSQKNENKAQITLKHVLTMTAGFHDHEGPPKKDIPGSPFLHILSKPLKSKPGEAFKYSNESSDLLGGVIYSLTGKQADEYAEENLFGPLGITNYYWEKENGIPHCHSDLHLLPRDMAKIGLLVLNDGNWNNQQIVSKEWVRESTKPHVKESKFFDYGYQWWHRSKNNLQWWKEPNTVSPKEHDLVTALGYGGQYIMIIRDLNLVVVTTASDYDYSDGGHMARSKIPMTVEKIIPALEN